MSTQQTQPQLTLTYEERQALATIRRALRKKPELAAAIMEGMGEEVATRALIQVRNELTMMLRVSSEFAKAAGKLAEAKQPAPTGATTKENNHEAS